MNRNLALAYIALAAVCIIWGTTYLALRVAVVSFPPLLFTALRQIIAGSIILGIVSAGGKASMPTWKHIVRQAVAGFFMISLGNGLVAWGEVYVPSGIAAIICSLMPAVVILMNLAISRDEKTNALVVGGIALGLGGIVLIFSEHLADLARPEYITGIVVIFTAVVAWAAGSIWIKKRNTESNLFVNAGIQMMAGGFWLLPASLALEDYTNLNWTGEALLPFIYLVVFGSVIAYVSYSYMLRKLPMTIVSLYAYINPLVAVLLGWLILDEKFNTRIGVAFGITITGIYLVNRGYQQIRNWQATLEGEKHKLITD